MRENYYYQYYYLTNYVDYGSIGCRVSSVGIQNYAVGFWLKMNGFKGKKTSIFHGIKAF